MERIKKLNYIVLIILMSALSFGIQVVQNEGGVSENISTTATNEGLKSIVITILTMGIIGAGVIFFVFIFAWILMKVWKALTAYERKEDFLYNVFSTYLNQSHINYDTKLKKRNWKFLWVFWKRKPVFVENSKGVLKFVGSYHGETLVKEGFFMLSIINKVTMFKHIEQIVFIPLEIKDKIIKKIDVEKGRTLIIRCEGLDIVENADYFLIPLIREDKKNEFIDFSDMVHKKFIETITYKDVIKENLLSYRKGVIKAVETNPALHFKRRGGEDNK